LKPDAVRPRLLSPSLIVFLCAMILANIAWRMHGSLTGLFVQSLGADVEQVGLYFTVTAIVPLVFQIIGGFVSDSIGRIRAVAVGSIAGVIGYILTILAPSWRWLILAGSVSSLSSCFVGPSFQAFIAEQSSEENRARTFATVNSMYMIVGVVGPPIGGFVSQRYGFRAMYMVAGVLYAAATVIRLRMAVAAKQSARVAADNGAPAPDAAASGRSSLTLKGLWASLAAMATLIAAGGIMTWLFISDGLSDIASSLAYGLEPVYQANLFGMTPTQITSLSSIYSVVVMALLPAGGWFSDRFGERVGIVVGHMVWLVAHVGFLFAAGYPMFMLVWALYGIGDALVRPSSDSLISKVVPANLRGTAFGLVSTSIGLFSLPAPYLGGLLWDRISPLAPFVMRVVVGVLVIPLLWVKLAPAKAGVKPGAEPGAAAGTR
jgi:DHA1 family multidrug resistance protein-like MFS transporter